MRALSVKEKSMPAIHLELVGLNVDVGHAFLCESGVVPLLTTISVCPILFFPIDTDIFSLQLPDCFASFACDDSCEGLIDCAAGLSVLQNVIGPAKQLRFIGRAAQLVHDAMQRLQPAPADTAPERTPAVHVRYDAPPPPMSTSDEGGDALHARGFSCNSRLPLSKEATALCCAHAGKAAASGPAAPAFDAALVLDRRADLLSVLMTQFALEGSLDRHLPSGAVDATGFERGVLTVPTHLTQATGSAAPDGTTTRVRLSSADAVYAQVRCLPAAGIGQALAQRAAEVREVYARKDEMQSIKDLSEKFLPEFKRAQAVHKAVTSLLNFGHFVKAEAAKPHAVRRMELEARLVQQDSSLDLVTQLETEADGPPAETANPLQFLRLVAIASHTGVLRPRAHVAGIIRVLTDTWGAPALALYLQLARAGVICVADAGATAERFRAVRDEFSLVRAHSPVDDSKRRDDAENTPLHPDSIRYVYAGFAPLSVRLLQMMLGAPAMSFKRHERIMAMVGPVIEAANPMAVQTKPDAQSIRKILVFYVGGISYGELAAIRKLNILGDTPGGFKITILTTDLLSTRGGLIEPIRQLELTR